MHCTLALAIKAGRFGSLPQLTRVWNGGCKSGAPICGCTAAPLRMHASAVALAPRPTALCSLRRGGGHSVSSIPFHGMPPAWLPCLRAHALMQPATACRGGTPAVPLCSACACPSFLAHIGCACVWGAPPAHAAARAASASRPQFEGRNVTLVVHPRSTQPERQSGSRHQSVSQSLLPNKRDGDTRPLSSWSHARPGGATASQLDPRAHGCTQPVQAPRAPLHGAMLRAWCGRGVVPAQDGAAQLCSLQVEGGEAAAGATHGLQPNRSMCACFTISTCTAVWHAWCPSAFRSW